MGKLRWMSLGMVVALGACGDGLARPEPKSPAPATSPSPASASRPPSKPKPFVDPNKCAYHPPSAPKLAKVSGSTIEMGEKVFFETDSAKIDARSDALLRAVATVLVQNPAIDFVEVAGHADERGGDAKNKKLTADRAKAVMDRLISLNVPDVRLRSRGYSHHCPVDPAETDAAYEKNRRVELKILRQGGEDTGAKWGGCDAAKSQGMTPEPIPATAPQYGPKPKKGEKATEQNCEPPLIADAKAMKRGPDHVLDGKEFFGQTCIGLCNDFPKYVQSKKPDRTATPFLCDALRRKDDVDNLQSRFLYHADWLYELTRYSPIGSPERLAFRKRALSTYHAAFGVTSERKQQLIRMRLGDLYRWGGMFDEALVQYRAMIEKDCELGEARVGHAFVALTLYQSGPKDEAKLAQAWKELDAADAVKAEGTTVLIALLRSKILDSQGKSDEAKAMLQKVIDHNKSQYAKLKFDWHWTDFHIPQSSK